MLRIIFSLCFASTASAESPLTIEKFRAIVEGNAYFHAFEQGPPFGILSYQTGGAYAWSYQETECLFGRYEAGDDDQICTYGDLGNFNYCWTFYATKTGFRAIGQDGAQFIMTQTTDPLPCQGQIQS